jgi:hypothetical protein
LFLIKSTAIDIGNEPTLIVSVTLFVWSSITDTVFELSLATYMYSLAELKVM